jgi:1-acyl-sn-glycerol-3-phosphate acyltransferase
MLAHVLSVVPAGSEPQRLYSSALHYGFIAPLLLPAAFVEIRAAWRLLRLFFHVLKGLAIVRFQVPRMSMTELGLFKQRWGKQLLDILAVRLQAACDELPERAMIVCNHISWLDIAVIHAVTPAHFVCKEEVL